MSTLLMIYHRLLHLMELIPHALIALLGRFSIAAVFWLSGQTKIEGFAINIINGEYIFGWPTLARSTIFLFQYEYQLPLIPADIAAVLATIAEHVFPILILLGLGTRVSALALLIMTAVIQFLVYPSAYALHGVWAVVLLYLMKNGAGVFSLDYLIHKRYS
ncbi:DoxX family protein [Nitrincola schmidtii]|uniref:DoxX family protein n=1 Tax=Nitrincola schmidtii TaxID=1730894 RepID=UPI00124DF1D9|nr:DoxX family protein [Nitrincola schmidtii]